MREQESFQSFRRKETFINKSVRKIGIGAAALAVVSGFTAELKHEASHVPHTEQKTVERVIFRAQEHNLSKTITISVPGQ